MVHVRLRQNAGLQIGIARGRILDSTGLFGDQTRAIGVGIVRSAAKRSWKPRGTARAQVCASGDRARCRRTRCTRKWWLYNLLYANRKTDRDGSNAIPPQVGPLGERRPL